MGKVSIQRVIPENKRFIFLLIIRFAKQKINYELAM